MINLLIAALVASVITNIVQASIKTRYQVARITDKYTQEDAVGAKYYYFVVNYTGYANVIDSRTIKVTKGVYDYFNIGTFITI